MACKVFIFFIFMLASVAKGQANVVCPVGSLTMAGADGPRRVVEAWARAYATKCNGVEITTQGGGYPTGAARVCDNHILYPAVDMAGMSGRFFAPQAIPKQANGWSYECQKSDRNAILVRFVMME